MASTMRSRTSRGPSVPRARRTAGRAERGAETAIRASRSGGKADPKRAAVEAVVRIVARGLDVAADDPYALAQLVPRMLDILRLAQLVPEPAGAADDTWALFERAMSTPEVAYPADPR
ncbi:hypothetical protein [Streptomyces sp. NPDC059247]|uniref:hypothetical protein n=1 Tax=Streptomyces sp. NPDC059247 TaxID=3346790 RepID=UPI00368BADA7